MKIRLGRFSRLMALSLCGVVLVMLTLCSTALAKSNAEKFGEAVDLFVDGKCAKALPIFRAVHAESGSPNARLYIARCLQQTGDLPGAYNEMKGTVADASARAEAEPKYAATRDAAAAELALLEPQIAKILIAVADAPDNVTAEVDGKAVEIGETIAVTSGVLSVVVRAPGKAPIRREVTVSDGEMKTVALSLDGEVADPEPEEPTVEDEGPGVGTVRILGIGIATLGVVGVVLFAVTASSAKSEFDELVQLCSDTTCPDSEAERVSDGRSLTTLANVSLALGGVALVAGTIMIILGGPDEGEEDAESGDTAALTLTPIVGPTYLGLSGRF